MEITENWIGKVAGWKVFKSGRDLWKDGAVKKIEVAEDHSEVSGLVGGGEKPRRVRVIIHSEIEVEVKCACMHVRRTGETCNHAVALLLQSIHGACEKQQEWAAKKVEKVSAPAFEPVALRVELSPLFPEKSGNGLTIRFTPLEKELESHDIRLCAWFQSIGLLEIPNHLSVHVDYLAAFIIALEGHPQTMRGEEPVHIQSSGVRLPVSVQYSEEELGFSTLVRADLNIIKLGKSLAVWDSAGGNVLLPSFNKTLLNPSQIELLSNGGQLKIKTKEFIMRSDDWERVFDWGQSNLLEKLRVMPSPMSFIFQVEGSISRIKAKLQARYPGGLKCRAGVKADAALLSAFPMRDRNHAGRWLVRNEEAEYAAIRKVESMGFSQTSSEDWQLEGEEMVLDFLSGGLAELKKEWTVEITPQFTALQENLVRVQPDIQMQGSGEDWLAFDYGFKTDTGKQIPREMIEKMLRAGKRTATTKNGKRVVISAFDSEMMGEVLKDVNPRQEGGKYYISKHQGAYINRIKSFYGKSIDCSSESILKKLPTNIYGMLRDYQKEGVVWLYERMTNESSALLADDMGLGKTLQTLCVLDLMWKEKSGPALVVCPTSLLENWRDEAVRFFPDLKVLILHGPNRHEDFKRVDDHDLVITSYALVARDEEKYKSMQFTALVIDEASVIRNPDTQSAKALRKLQISKRLALTGTPLENALQDLWSIFEWMMPRYLGTREDFKNRYVKPSQTSMPNMDVLKRLRLRLEPFMLRRTKQEVATDLPPKIEQIVWCNPTDEQQALYKSLHQKGVEQVQVAAKENKGRARMQMLTVLLRLRQACCDVRLLGKEMADMPVAEASAKLLHLLQLVRQAQEGGHRILVFSQFTSMLALIKESLEKENFTYSYLDGSTRNRGAVVKEFQSDSGPLIFLISLKAGGYGLNLTAADMVVHFDPWWNPAVEAQATDRAYRIGQSKPVNVYKLVTKGTVEEKIIRLQEQKKSLIGATVDDDVMMTGLSPTEISSILDD